MNRHISAGSARGLLMPVCSATTEKRGGARGGRYRHDPLQPRGPAALAESPSYKVPESCGLAESPSYNT